ncbi:copper-binding protein [Erwinia mallotivora]|uniref:copper-binding protein n=1 Tax=Erwinia mallotivora TaxID=69222 RepID=UPI0035EB8E52
MHILFKLFAVATVALPAFNAGAADHHMDSQPLSARHSDAAQVFASSGTIKAWGEDTVSLAHQPIPQLNWPAMTMHFSLDGYQGQRFTAGQQVNFTFRQTDSGYALISVTAK